MNTNDKKNDEKGVKKQSSTQRKKKTVLKSFVFLSGLCFIGLVLLFLLKPNVFQDTSAINDFTSFLSDKNLETKEKDNSEITQKPKQQTTSNNDIEKTQPKDTQQKPTQTKDAIANQTPKESTQEQTIQQKNTQPKEETQPKETQHIVTQPQTTQPKETQPKVTQPKQTNTVQFEKVEKGKAKLVFVIDDAGHNLNDLKPFTALPFNVSIAVLPRLRYSVEAAEMIRKSNKEILLHQPMQAVNLSVSPGPGAITPQMNYSEITELLIDNVNQIGPITAINNHEGSLITQSSLAMGAVLDFCTEHNLFFLDSRTIASSVVREEANKRNMKILERSVFLDNTQDTQSILAAIQDGTKTAKNKGAAIMIGHVWCEKLADVLLSVYPELISSGYDVTTLTELLTEQ